MNLKRRLNTTIYVASPIGGTGHYGKSTFEAPRPVQARVEPSTVKRDDGNGSVIQAKHFLITEDAITSNDRVWLAGTDTSKPEQAERPLGPVDGVLGLGGAIHHYETYLG